MSKIHILSEEVRNQIAAGEVIERPASVVKELVENAIDAGATNIVVIVDHGGKDLIQVIDNGSGMKEDDAILSLERHATSKIRTVHDIVQIHSLGFRGEALPSIASICRFTMITRNEESDLATRIEYSDGKLKEISKTSSNPGTSITVKSIFKNIPARRKFLRSDNAEFRHILKYFHYQAIIYPEISFKLIADGREKLSYVACNDRINRMAEVFGSAFFTDDVISIDTAVDNYELQGFIFGLEEQSDRLIETQYVFINGRYVNDKTVKHSINSAYKPFIMKTRLWQKGTTPPYILFLNVPAEYIDVNVHPAKQEVRFRDQQRVHSLVFNAISRALTDYENRKFESARDKFNYASQLDKATPLETDLYKHRVEIPRFSEYKKEFGNLYQDDILPQERPQSPNRTIPIVNEQLSASSEQLDLLPNMPNDSISYPTLIKNEEDYINPWQLHNTYIFIQVEDGLVVIDQHAAHERIIYEKLIHRTKGAPPMRQKLLIPLVIDIPPYIALEIRELLDNNMELMHKVGFSLKKFSGDSLVIEEIPAELDDWQGGKVFIEILKQLESEIEINSDFQDSLAKSIACKAAIKAGKSLSRKEMLNLVNDLFACQTPFFCPHGRPLIIKMTLQEFEKKFKRLL
ncbi:MAG: DNA mismatch repair protein MutL [Candidatus Cloacimonetes bacterium HGW-Cloacimonetes-1]|jgi:DNA mismatch repair protein MutL|nr:MAG: DNA mismatch repair protein MutL [Candidatus Cloacimonetes bacterium HGW-Cloacimonetes-1]